MTRPVFGQPDLFASPVKKPEPTGKWHDVHDHRDGLTPPRPSHIYIARGDCGCCLGSVADYRDKATGATVAEMIGQGWIIERVEWMDYRNRVAEEVGYMHIGGCRLDASPPQGGPKE
jgi:hypothetical protein